MKNIVLKVAKREITGRKVKQLRKKQILPANLYGSKIKSVCLQIPVSVFLPVYKEAGETQLVELKIDGEKTSRHAIIQHPQKDPVSGQWLHVDLRQVQLTEKLEAEIPVELIGESPAKDKGGVMVQMVNSIRVEALPTDLPEKFELDISGLKEIGDNRTLKDIKHDKKVRFLDEDPERLVVKIEEPTKEEVVVEPVVDESEVETAGEAVEGKTETKPTEPAGKEEKKEVKEPKEDK
jgi:large subunit ribosomal protein L25